MQQNSTYIPPANDFVFNLTAYPPGKPITQLSRELGIPEEKIIKLASNENPLGMSPKAKQAIQNLLNSANDGIARYPDQFALSKKIADRCQIQQNQIVLGNGSNNLLDIAGKIFLNKQTNAVCAEFAFSVYCLATLAANSQIRVAKAKDFGHDLSAVYDLTDENTRIIWIANPNNPTGTFLPHQEIYEFIKKVNQKFQNSVVIILDEAYNEYLPPEKRGDATKWLADFPNLIVSRTFSKIYGLAGLRIGYAAMSAELAELFHKIRTPFNANNLALLAAEVALDDQEFLSQSYQINAEGMTFLEQGLQQLGFDFIASSGNFITMFCDPNLGQNAADINQKLLENGVIIRPLMGYQMPNHLRITIGTKEENQRFLETLAKIMKK